MSACKSASTSRTIKIRDCLLFGNVTMKNQLLLDLSATLLSPLSFRIYLVLNKISRVNFQFVFFDKYKGSIS